MKRLMGWFLAAVVLLNMAPLAALAAEPAEPGGAVLAEDSAAIEEDAAPDEADAAEKASTPVQEPAPADVSVDCFFDQLADKAIDGLALIGQEDNFEKVRRAYAAIIAGTAYIPFDDPLLTGVWAWLDDCGQPPSIWQATAVSPLVFGIGSCENYACALMLLLERMGFETLYVSGLTRSWDGLMVDHAWAMVNIDGVWYHIDPQLEWNTLVDNHIAYRRFLKSDDEFAASHLWGSRLQNPDAHALSLPECPVSAPSLAYEAIQPQPEPDVEQAQARAREIMAASEPSGLTVEGALPQWPRDRAAATALEGEVPQLAAETGEPEAVPMDDGTRDGQTEASSALPAAAYTGNPVMDFEALEAAVDAFNAGAADMEIEIGANFSMTGNLGINNANGKTLTIQSAAGAGAPYTLSRGFPYAQLDVSAGAKLILRNLIIDGKKDSYSSGSALVRVAGGTLTLADGAALQNAQNGRMAAVHLMEEDGRGSIFTMTGGVISGNTTASTTGAGGVLVGPGSTFTMAGGVISGNTALNYGGVLVSTGGTFSMQGGTISNNATTDPYSYGRGGGVHILSDGTFTMDAGKISGNTASWGGGVDVSPGATFTMGGGEISGNTATWGGGVSTSGTTSMTDGVISGNTANTYGGGVCVFYDSSFIMSGGEISGNTSRSSGGGVFNFGRTVFTMDGGEINGNTATYSGSGVMVLGSFILNGGEISGNTAMTDGGGVCVAIYAAFTMTGGKISGNTAELGGGVCVRDTFAMQGGEISGNTASEFGGGVYLGGATTGGKGTPEVPFACTVTLGGTAVINGNTVGGAADNAQFASGNYIILGTGANGVPAPAMGMRVGITPSAADNVFVQSGADAATAVFFFSDDPVKPVVLDDGALKIGLSPTGGTDADKVKADTNALTPDAIKGGNTGSDAITSDLALPTTGGSGSTITWTSAPPGYVDPVTGKVTRPPAGQQDVEVTLTATITSGNVTEKVTITVTVMAEAEGVVAASVKLAQKSIRFAKNQKATIGVVVYLSDGSTTSGGLTWTSSNEKVAVVKDNGQVTGKKAGKATITAVAANGQSATLKVTVVAKAVKVTKVTIDGAKKTLDVGKTLQLKVKKISPSNATNAAVIWKSSNPSVLHVDKVGKITALKEGKATITLKAGGQTAKVTITVAAPVSKITVDKTKVSLAKKGNTVVITPTVTYSQEGFTAKLSWKSSNTKVATVKNGKITAKGKGRATITVSASNGKSAKIKVTVQK